MYPIDEAVVLAMQIPLNRLLLETDSPDGLPPLQRRGCQPLEVVPPAEATCSASEQGVEEAADQRLNHPANVRYA